MGQVSVLPSGASSAQDPTIDQVEALGRQLGDTISAFHEADRLSFGQKDEGKKVEINVLGRALYRRQRSLEAAIPAIEAKTLGGAMVDVILAEYCTTRIGDILDEMNPGPEGEDVTEVRELLQRLHFVLHSAAGVLKEAAPGVFEACGGEFYMEDRFNPFLALGLERDFAVLHKEKNELVNGASRGADGVL